MAGVKGRSGGRRPGSGPKPKDARLALLHGSRDRGTRPAVDAAPVVITAGVIQPPADLPADQLAVWRDLAPHALRELTLTAETALAFRDLCEAIVIKRRMLAEIEADGYMTSKVTLQMDEKGGGLQSVEKKAHSLWPQFRGLMQRVETGYMRFRLTPDGKQRAANAEPKAKSALEILQEQSAQMRRPVGVK